MRAVPRLRAGAAGILMVLCATGAAIELSPQELAGRSIFREGIGADGQPVSARVGLADSPVPGHVVPCGNCHGSDGLGRAESGVQPPAIVWSELTKAYGHRHENGRAHPAFDVPGVLRAVTQGVDPGGNRMDRAMPRYALGREDQENLVAYLQRLEADVDPGVHADGLRIGTLLPLSGVSAESGRLALRVLEAYFSDVNAAGGIYGRKLELVSHDSGAPLQGRPRWPALEEGADVLALVAPFVPGQEGELIAQAEAHHVPLVGPLGPMAAGAAAAVPRYSFFVQPGLRELVRALAVHAAGRSATELAPLLLVISDDPSYESLGEALRDQCRRTRCGPITSHRFGTGRFDAGAALSALRDSGSDTILFLAPETELASFLLAADAASSYPTLLLPAAMGVRAAVRAPAGFAGRILLAYPSSPEEALHEGGRFEAFRVRHGLPASGLSTQMSAYAAAALATEGLRRGGRAIGREKLVTALETLRGFRTDASPPLSFGPDRRIGALGGHVVSLEAGARFRTVRPWLSLD